MRLCDFADFINRCDFRNQQITVNATRWRNLLTEQQQIMTGYDFANNFQLSREDIFQTEVSELKILKTLMWGFNNGGRGNNVYNLLLHLNELVALLGQDDLILNEMLYNNIMRIEGIGPSTLSKLVYFFNIPVGEYASLIIDSNVEIAMNNFSDFARYPKYVNSFNEYYSYVRKMHRISRTFNIENVGNIEYFLFCFGRDISRSLRDLKTEILQNQPY